MNRRGFLGSAASVAALAAAPVAASVPAVAAAPAPATTLIVGGGPAGTALLTAATKRGLLPQLAASGLIVVERDGAIGGGRLGNRRRGLVGPSVAVRRGFWPASRGWARRPGALAGRRRLGPRGPGARPAITFHRRCRSCRR